MSLRSEQDDGWHLWVRRCRGVPGTDRHARPPLRLRREQHDDRRCGRQRPRRGQRLAAGHRNPYARWRRPRGAASRSDQRLHRSDARAVVDMAGGTGKPAVDFFRHGPTGYAGGLGMQRHQHAVPRGILVSLLHERDSHVGAGAGRVRRCRRVPGSDRLRGGAAVHRRPPGLGGREHLDRCQRSADRRSVVPTQHRRTAGRRPLLVGRRKWQRTRRGLRELACRRAR